MKELCISLGVALLVTILFVAWNPIGRGLWNANQYAVQKVDDATRYSTRKKVEDSCRAMMESLCFPTRENLWLSANGWNWWTTASILS